MSVCYGDCFIRFGLIIKQYIIWMEFSYVREIVLYVGGMIKL